MNDNLIIPMIIKIQSLSFSDFQSCIITLPTYIRSYFWNEAIQFI